MRTKNKIKYVKRDFKKEPLTIKESSCVYGATVSAFNLNHYLSEIAALGLFPTNTLKEVNKLANILEKIERNFLHKMEEADAKEITTTVIDNNLAFNNWLTRNTNFYERVKLHEIYYAFGLDEKRIVGLSNKILKENGAKSK